MKSRLYLSISLLVVMVSCSGSPEKPDEDPTSETADGENGSAEAASAGRVDLGLKLGEKETGGEVGEVIPALGAELQRAMDGLADREHPPYYTSYQVTDEKNRYVTSTFGAVDTADDSHHRTLDVVVRVGSYDLDNTHELRGEWYGDYSRSSGVSFPLDDVLAYRNILWRSTDQYYKDAVERFLKVRANYDVKAPETDKSADFTRVDPIEHIQPTGELSGDTAEWKTRTRRLSAVFRDDQEIESAAVTFDESVETRYQVTSEGAKVRKSRHTARISWYANTTADDGMRIFLFDSADAYDPAGLPPLEELEENVTETAALLRKLRNAPTAEPFVGPAILEGEPAGVFFHEALGHRVEGHRQADEDEGQTFKEKVGEQVLPTFLDVYDDPRLVAAGDVPLMGHYVVDDQAVPAQRATIVDDGIFKGFLMSRTPIRDFENSNGHGRREPGKHVVARQGNLIAHPSRTVTRDRLKEKLIDEIKRQDKPYGLRFVKVQGGYTLTQRGMPQSFRVLPLVVYRVYPDGREELIRGVTLEGTPLTVLSEIQAAADDADVFNGVCGAESGHVPVSSVSPSLLVRRIETARAPKGAERPPILPPPPLEPDHEPEKGDD